MKKTKKYFALCLAAAMILAMVPYSPFPTLATEAISLDEYERDNYLLPDSLPMDAAPTVITPQNVGFTAGTSSVQLLDGDDWQMAASGDTEGRVGIDATDLLGYWPFDEGTGTAITDTTGNHADLTVSNGTFVTGANGSGNALNFTGASTSCATGTTTADLGENFTISLFINAPSNVANWRVFMAKGATATGDWQLYFHSQKVRFYGEGLSTEEISSSTVIADGTWHHIAVTLDNGTLTMYVDGAADATVTGVTGGLSNGERVLNFGRKDGGSNAACTLDEARIYGRALSAAEIAALAEQTTTADWSDSIAATVPASVHTNLLNAGLLEDPYVSLNDAAAQAESLKTWWMKKTFTYSGDGNNVRLNFEGLCDRAEIWLNNVNIGSHQGMFGGPYIDVTDVIRQGNNTLVVRLDPAINYKETVVFNCSYGWHYAKIWPLGIWNSVSVEDVATVEIVDPFIAAKDIATGTMDFTVDLNAEAAFSGTLKLKVSPKNFSGSETVYTYAVSSETGSATTRLQFDIPDPQLWWPNGYGEQNLYWLEVSFEDTDGNVVDYDKTSFGIRTIEMGPTPSGETQEGYNWTFIVNGKSIFMKGTGWCTTDALMRFTEESYDTQLSRAKAQGINFLRAWGGGMPETETFYDLCDEYGLCVYQEWPIHDESYDTQPAEVLHETVELNTRRLRNRPSLIMWGGGNECDAELENEVLNQIGKRTLENDGTRPWHRQDPYGTGSSHNYNTYWGGQPLDRYLNVSDTFLSEFGLASMPNIESIRKYADAEELNVWPIESGSDIWHHTPLFGNCSSSYASGDIAMMSYFADEFIELNSVEDLVVGTQLAQAVGIRHTLENTRTLWPNSTGIAYYKMNDIYPAASWSTVDWYGSPKMSYYFLQDAYQSLAAVGVVKALNSYGKDLSIPIWLLDDNDALAGSEWEVSARAYNGGLALVKEVTFSGSDSIDSTAKLGELVLSAQQTETAPLFIVTDVIRDGTLAARNYFFLNYEAAIGSLFALPVTTLNYKQDGSTVTVTNTGDRPAVAANLTFADSTVVTPSDNFIWLEPNESQVITLEGVGGASVESSVTGLTAWNAKDESDSAAPSAPSALTAVSNGCDRITLSWNAAEDVACYNIYRDGALVATVSGKVNTYTDYALSESTQYTYTVCAVDQGGNESAASSASKAVTSADVTQPALLMATMTDMGTVILKFSEPLDPVSAETATNYTLNGGATVTAATLHSDGRTVTLTVSSTEKKDYALTVSGVTDVDGYAMIPAVKFVAPDLLGYWPFDEGSGTTTADTTGNHADLTVSNGTFVTGKNGTALNLTGASTSYATGTTTADLGENFTISLFINAPSDVANWRVFMAKGATATGDWQLYFHSKKVRFYGEGLSTEEISSSTVIADGTWHHIAVTLDDGTLTMYVDGKVDATVTGITGGLTNGSRPLNFGRKDGGTNAACTLDEARIYGRALSAAEIAALAAGSAALPTVDAAAFKGATVTLGDDLDLNFSVDVPDSIKQDGMKATFTLDGVALPDAVLASKDDKGYYIVTAEVPAKDMTGELVARLTSADGAVIYTAKVYSIREYGEAIINGDYTDAEKAAAKAMLNYGAAAQVHLSHKVEDLANINCAYTQEELDAADLGEFSGVYTDTETIPQACYGATLLLKSKIRIRLYFTENLDNALTYSAANQLYFCEFTGIGAGALATMQSITLDGVTYEVSVLSLAKLVVDHNAYDTDFKNLMKAIALYYNAANAL